MRNVFWPEVSLRGSTISNGMLTIRHLTLLLLKKHSWMVVLTSCATNVQRVRSAGWGRREDAYNKPHCRRQNTFTKYLCPPYCLHTLLMVLFPTVPLIGMNIIVIVYELLLGSWNSDAVYVTYKQGHVESDSRSVREKFMLTRLMTHFHYYGVCIDGSF